MLTAAKASSDMPADHAAAMMPATDTGHSAAGGTTTRANRSRNAFSIRQP